MRNYFLYIRNIKYSWNVINQKRLSRFLFNIDRQITSFDFNQIRFLSSSGDDKNNDNVNNFESLIKPAPSPIDFPEEFGNIGEELTGKKLTKEDIIPVLNKFVQRPTIREAAAEYGLKPKLFLEAFSSYRKKVLEAKVLDPELHVILCDIISGHKHVDDLYKSFMKHAKTIFPHIDCLDDLKKISDLRLPPNWYPEARKMNRKFYFHSGPTNSGKTFHALNRFLEAKSGIYCGPLKMLAVEVYQKANNSG